ncbi:hypothetical protein EJ110_NYTH14363 [Nymphaea thermarum]|nr:hypothetical protein EJ110_NYTH14363 [Nymphaea thermarum]
MGLPSSSSRLLVTSDEDYGCIYPDLHLNLVEAQVSTLISLSLTTPATAAAATVVAVAAASLETLCVARVCRCPLLLWCCLIFCLMLLLLHNGVASHILPDIATSTAAVLLSLDCLGYARRSSLPLIVVPLPLPLPSSVCLPLVFLVAVGVLYYRRCPCLLASTSALAITQAPCLVPLLLMSLFSLQGWSVVMASSSSSTINTDQTEIGAHRTENVPVQVTTIRLTKENYLPWSAAMTMGIAGHGRIAYINGRKPERAETSGVWDTWFLEDNKVKTWIVNSIFADIQPLILRKKTARDMSVILEQMYGQKKKAIRTYQLMKTVYRLRQGNLSVADYYGALKAKWEDLDYYSDITWHCPQDQTLHVAKEWENRVFRFLAGLNDVYSRVEAEEQRRLVTTEGKRDLMSYNERSAFVSRGPGGTSRSLRRYTHCKKIGHTVDLCWDLHPEKKDNKGRSSNGKPTVSEETKSSGGKVSISAEQLHELRAYLGRIYVNQVEPSDETKANHTLAIVGDKGNSCVGEWIEDSGATHHMTGSKGGRLLLQS